MTLAEIISRLGGAIGGWLIYFGHMLTLSVLAQADCDPTSDELWRGTLLFAFVSGIGLVFAGRGLKWAKTLRWVVIPALLLSLLAAKTIVPALLSTTLGEAPLCAIAVPTGPIEGLTATSLERIWPIAQTAIILVGVFQATRYWRAPNPD